MRSATPVELVRNAAGHGDVYVTSTPGARGARTFRARCVECGRSLDVSDNASQGGDVVGRLARWLLEELALEPCRW